MLAAILTLILTFTFRPQAISVDSSNRFPLTAWTDRPTAHTHKHAPTQGHRHYCTTGVDNNCNINVYCEQLV